MDRFFFDQNVNQYYQWLVKEHCTMVQNESLIRYLHKRALMFSYADHYISTLGLDEKQVFEMLLMDKNEQEEYKKLHPATESNYKQ